MFGIELFHFFELLVNGFTLGALYSCIGIGFVVIYKSTGILNFAQGEIMMIGTYICFMLIEKLNISIFGSVFITMALMASFGILLDRIIFRPLLGEPVFTSIMVTIGLSIVLRIATLVIFGYENYSFPAIFPETTITFLGIKISLAYLGIIFSVSLLILIFTMLFKFTKIGLAMRATAFNQIISLFMGINVKRIYAISWAVSSVIATVSGIMLASVHVLNPNLSFQALKAFPAIVIGGLESIPGAIVGGLIIGVIENLSSAYLGDVFGIGITDFMVFSTLFVVLFIRPYGFFGVREIERI